MLQQDVGPLTLRRLFFASQVLSEAVPVSFQDTAAPHWQPNYLAESDFRSYSGIQRLR
jgi:hypothetical protein